MARRNRLPLWLKIIYTLPVCTLVPIHLNDYGLSHFLWFSNVALLATVAVLWLESRLLASMMTLAILLPEIGWNLDFLIGVFIGESPFGFTAYMFDEDMPILLRGFSLYHVPLPFLLLWITLKLGYEPSALRWQTLLGWTILLASYHYGTPAGTSTGPTPPICGSGFPGPPG